MREDHRELAVSRWLVIGTLTTHLVSLGFSAFSGTTPTNGEAVRNARPIYVGMSWPGLAPRGQAVNVAIPDEMSCPAGFAGSAAVLGVPGTGTVRINQISGGVSVPGGGIVFAGMVGIGMGRGLRLHHNDAVQFIFPNDDLTDVAITLKCERE